MFDLVEVGEGKVRYGDGCLWYKCAFFWLFNSSYFDDLVASFLVVTFRMVVFRPFVSEVMLAKVKSSDEDGIRRMPCLAPRCVLSFPSSCLHPAVSVGFFDDMYIPSTYLPEPSALYV